MSLNTIKPDLVRYEMRMVQGQNPHVREQKKPGAFGRFLSGMGKILGSIAMPLSFIFPPAALGAAGMYGVVAALERHGAHSFADVDLGSDKIVMRFDEEEPVIGGAVEIWTRRFHLFGSTGRAIAHIG